MHEAGKGQGEGGGEMARESMERREKGEKGEGKNKNHGDQGKNHKTKPIMPKQEGDPKLNEEIKPKGDLLHHYGMNLWKGGSPSSL